MPYCKYCLSENKAEDMPSPRTCKLCRDKQFRAGALKAKKKRSARRSYERNSVTYYFKKSRIKHAPFPQDIDNLEAIFKQALGANRYKRRLLSVDHIIPVVHPLVSGLTVSWNLQILTYEENSRKNNTCDLDLQAQHLLVWARRQGL